MESWMGWDLAVAELVRLRVAEDVDHLSNHHTAPLHTQISLTRRSEVGTDAPISLYTPTTYHLPPPSIYSPGLVAPVYAICLISPGG